MYIFRESEFSCVLHLSVRSICIYNANFHDATGAAAAAADAIGHYMQRQMEMQLRGVEAQVKGQNQVMVRLLKEMKKKDCKEKRRRRRMQGRRG